MSDPVEPRTARRFLQLLEDVQAAQGAYAEEVRVLRTRLRLMESARGIPPCGSTGWAAYVVSMEGLILEWSQEAEGLYGFTAEETHGRPVAMLGSASAGEEERGVRRTSDGRSFQVRQHCILLLDALGLPTGRLHLEFACQAAGEDQPGGAP